MNPSPEQEEQWAAEKQECYLRWREEKLSRAVAYLESSPKSAHREIYARIGRKFGKRFVRDLMERM